MTITAVILRRSRRISLSLLLLLTTTASAEPWLGNRFAQNCAGCHSPGRKNLKPSERRCSLSCQGCHVNPNGGGLRSFYGKWTQDRWLRSFRVVGEKTTQSFVPSKKQMHGQKPFDPEFHKKNEWTSNEGYPLVKDENVYIDDQKAYDKSDNLEKTTSRNRAEFMYQIAKEDPYRAFDLSRADGGGDIRYLFRSLASEDNSNINVKDSALKEQNFLMSVEPSIRFRPIHRYLHLVYEGRIMGNPSEKEHRAKTFSTAGTRSMYALLDNMPYNTYLMAGYYRPIIGNYTPDHNALAQRMLANTILKTPQAYKLLFNAVSVGTAPNVPFLNVHVIQQKMMVGAEIDGDQTKGFAINGGLRFVTLGGAVNYSYWRTNDDNPNSIGGKTKTEISSFGIAGQLGRMTVSIDALSLARDELEIDFRRGGVFTLDTQTRVWRENYFVAQVAMANRASDLLPGGTSQTKIGWRGFHISGLETMITYDSEEETTDGEKGEPDNTRKTSYITGQAHLFF